MVPDSSSSDSQGYGAHADAWGGGRRDNASRPIPGFYDEEAEDQEEQDYQDIFNARHGIANPIEEEDDDDSSDRSDWGRQVNQPEGGWGAGGAVGAEGWDDDDVLSDEQPVGWGEAINEDQPANDENWMVDNMEDEDDLNEDVRDHEALVGEGSFEGDSQIFFDDNGQPVYSDELNDDIDDDEFDEIIGSNDIDDIIERDEASEEDDFP